MEHDPEHEEEYGSPGHHDAYHVRKSWVLPVLESCGHKSSNHESQDRPGIHISRKMRAANNAADPDQSTQ